MAPFPVAQIAHNSSTSFDIENPTVPVLNHKWLVYARTSKEEMRQPHTHGTCTASTS